MIDLKEIAVEIRDILDKKREELGLSFIEEDHIYFMKDKDGKLRDDFPSVSKVLISCASNICAIVKLPSVLFILMSLLVE